MSDDSVTIVLEFEGEVDPSIATELSAETGAPTRTIEQHGLEGALNTWLVIGHFVVDSLATLVPLVTIALQARRTKTIKVGDVIIENPSPEQVTELLQSRNRRGSN